jgi:hypothetical protein
VKLVDFPCRFYDEPDGFCSMSIIISIDFRHADGSSLPLHWWCLYDSSKLRSPQTVDSYQLWYFDSDGLDGVVKTGIANVFADARYSLQDLRAFTSSQMKHVVQLMFNPSTGALQVERVSDFSFWSRTEFDNSRRSNELEELRHEQEMRVLVEKKALELESYRNSLLQQRAMAELRKKQLEQDLSIGDEQVRQNLLETIRREKEIEVLELRLKEAEHRVVEAESKRKNETAISSLLSDLDDTIATLGKGLQSIKTGQAAHVKSLDNIVERIEKTLENTNAKIDAMDMRNERLYKELQDERYDSNNYLKQFITAEMRRKMPTMANSIHEASLRTEFMRCVRSRINFSNAGLPVAVGMVLEDGTIIDPEGAAKSMTRGSTYAQEAVSVGAKYKLRIELPKAGYVWVFHISRKIAEPIHLLYPFVNDVMESNPSYKPTIRPGLVFPDDVAGISGFLTQTESALGEGYDRDAFLVLYSMATLDIFSNYPSPGSIELDTHLEFSSSFSHRPCYLVLDRLQELDPRSWGCGMVEYKATG